MENSQARTTFTWIIFAICLAVVGFAMFGESTRKGGIAEEDAADLATRAGVPKDTIVPEPESKGIPENVAIPSVSNPSLAGSETHTRIFNIEINGGAFVPDTIVGYVGDELRINMRAVDRNYDFRQPDYGLRQEFARGETKTVTFGASAAGMFMFYCESCGGPEKGPRGTLVVKGR